MAASNILNNRTASELSDAVRRLLNDTDTEKVFVAAGTLRETIISQYVLFQHELGWNPQIPLRPTTGNAMLTYTLAAGAYQTTQEGESDVVAMSYVWIDRSNTPLVFEARETLEGWINHDVKINGSVRRGIPSHWTIRVDWTGTPPSEMKHRMLVYPAADETTVVYWPRTVVDTEAVDPSSTGKMPFSYQATFAFEHKVAALMVKLLSDDQLKKLKIDRGAFDVLWGEYKAALDRERAERAQHVVRDHVKMGSRGW